MTGQEDQKRDDSLWLHCAGSCVKIEISCPNISAKYQVQRNVSWSLTVWSVRMRASGGVSSLDFPASRQNNCFSNSNWPTSKIAPGETGSLGRPVRSKVTCAPGTGGGQNSNQQLGAVGNVRDPLLKPKSAAVGNAECSMIQTIPWKHKVRCCSMVSLGAGLTPFEPDPVRKKNHQRFGRYHYVDHTWEYQKHQIWKSSVNNEARGDFNGALYSILDTHAQNEKIRSHLL